MPGRMAKEEDAGNGGRSFESRQSLEKATPYLRTIKWCFEALDSKEIEVNPEYQRDVVWTHDRMSELIDSLMENFYIPPIILNRKTDEFGKSTLVCVDGKQRLSSVQMFVKGIVPCHDRHGKKWWFANPHNGRNKDILPETLQKKFLEKEFVTFEYTDIRAEQEEDLFARVQMGMPLSAAEKMRATSGPWQELTRCFVRDFPRIISLQKDVMRGKDFQYTLQCFSQIMEVQQSSAAEPTLKATAPHLPKLLNDPESLDDNIKSHLASVWKTFQDLIELDPNTFTNKVKWLKGVQTFAPIEMVAVTVLISVYSEARNNRLLLNDIKELRQSLRENFNDLRIHSGVWKQIWNFIHNIDRNRGTADQVQPRATPKKGRTTTRTKPATILLGAGHNKVATAIKSEPKEPELDESRPRKRQRTADTSSATPPAIASSSSPPAMSTSPSESQEPSGSQEMPLRPPARDSPLQQASELQQSAAAPPNPIHNVEKIPPCASMGPPAPVPPVRPVRQQSAPSGVTKLNTLDTRPQVLTKVQSASNTLSTPPTTPLEARQNRGAELDGYRVPVTPMGPGAGAKDSATPVIPPINNALKLFGSSLKTTPTATVPSTGPASVFARSPQSAVLSAPPTGSVKQGRWQSQPAKSPTGKQAPLSNQQRAWSTSRRLMQPPSPPQEPVSALPTTQVRPTAAVSIAKATPKPRPASTSQLRFPNVIDLTEEEPEEGSEQQRVNLLSSFQKGTTVQTPRATTAAAVPREEDDAARLARIKAQMAEQRKRINASC